MFVLDIGQDAGALVVYTVPALKDKEVEISFNDGGPPKKVHTGVVERDLNGHPTWTAVFPSLKSGEYTLWRPESRCSSVVISAGEVSELDWTE